MTRDVFFSRSTSRVVPHRKTSLIQLTSNNVIDLYQRSVEYIAHLVPADA